MEIDDGVWVRFKADISDIQAKMAALPGIIQGAAAGLSNAFNLERLSIGAISLGSALTNAISVPLSNIKDQSLTAFAGFEASMARVQAMTGETKNALKGLSDQALELGSTTQFSSTKIATAMGDLASAGLNVQEIFKAVPGVLDFAAAGQMKLADAAKVATNVMHQYGMEAGDMGKIADIIAHAASKSSAEVSDMGVAFNYFGTVAKQSHVSLAETAAAFEILADAGTRGSKAGTAMSQMLSRLEGMGSKTANAIKGLGIELRDAEGKLLPMDKLIENLSPLLDNAGFGFKVFGQRWREVAALIDAGPEKFRALTKAAEETAGASKQMANTLMQGYQGELKKFNDELDSMKVKIGDALAPAAEAMLKNFGEPVVKMIGDLADGFTKLPAPIQQAGLAVATIAQWAGPAVVALGQLGLAWPLITSGASLLASTLGPLIPSLTSLGTAAAVAASAFAGWKLGSWLYENVPLVKQFGDALGDWIVKIPAVSRAIESWNGVPAATKSFADAVSMLEAKLRAQGVVIDKTGLSMEEYSKKLRQAALDHAPVVTAANAAVAATQKLPPEVQKIVEAYKAQAQQAQAAMAAQQRQAQVANDAARAQQEALAKAQQAAALLAQTISQAGQQTQQVLTSVPKAIDSVLNALDPKRINFSGIFAQVDQAIVNVQQQAAKLVQQFGEQMPAAIRGMLVSLKLAEDSLVNMRRSTEDWQAAFAGLDGEFQTLDASIKASGEHTADFSHALEGIAGVSVPEFRELNTQVNTLGNVSIPNTTKQVSGMSRMWDDAIRGFERGIASIILQGKSAGEVFGQLGRQMLSAFLDQTLHAGMKALIGGLFNIEGAVGSLSKAFSSLGGTMSSVLGGGSSAAGGAAGGIQGAVGGITGALGAIGSIGGMISGIIGNFQNARQETTLNAIEESTRYTKSYLRDNIVPDEQKYWPNLDKLAQLLRLEGIENGITKLAEGSGGSLANQLGRVIVPPLNELGNDIVGLGQALSIALNSFMLDFTSGIYSQLEVLIQETRAFRTQAIPFLQAMAQSTIALYNTMAKPGNGVNYFQVVGQSANGGGGGGNTFNVNVNGNSTDAYRVGQMVVQGINSQLGVRV